MPFSEPNLDSAREAIRSCISELMAASTGFKQGHSRQAQRTIGATCSKMLPHVIRLTRDMQEAKENCKFLVWLSLPPIQNAEAIISLAQRLVNLTDSVQYDERSNIHDAHVEPSGRGQHSSGSKSADAAPP